MTLKKFPDINQTLILPSCLCFMMFCWQLLEMISLFPRVERPFMWTKVRGAQELCKRMLLFHGGSAVSTLLHMSHISRGRRWPFLLRSWHPRPFPAAPGQLWWGEKTSTSRALTLALVSFLTQLFVSFVVDHVSGTLLAFSLHNMTWRNEKFSPRLLSGV